MNAPSPFEARGLFATPLLTMHLDEAAAIGPALEAAILARRAVDRGVLRSNRDGWHSREDLPGWGGDAAATVIRRAIACADVATRSRDGNRVAWRATAWANVIEDGGSNEAHVHPGAVWSAVYYVRVDPGRGGALMFHDPRGAAPAMAAAGLTVDPAGGDGAIELAPRAGLLVLFPAWLAHSVVRYRGPGRRVSIAINLAAP